MDVVGVVLLAAALVGASWALRRQQAEMDRMRREIEICRALTVAVIMDERRRQRAEERQVAEWLG